MSISIRAPARGATQLARDSAMAILHFNPRSREGSDYSESYKVTTAQEFQSALPRGERPADDLYPADPMDFNPRSREGSDVVSVCNGGVDVEISIRAPARGATYVLVFDERVVMISIRAPARGATPASPELTEPGVISIRAPARGATKLTPKLNYVVNVISIRAPARGATSFGVVLLCKITYFNPRSREGSDRVFRDFVVSCGISIRAPARGATMEQLAGYLTKDISIRAPARGATEGLPGSNHQNPISIRAPARGATMEQLAGYLTKDISIRAPARGATVSG